MLDENQQPAHMQQTYTPVVHKCYYRADPAEPDQHHTGALTLLVLPKVCLMS